MKKIKIKLPDGKIIKRVPKAESLGNFVNIYIRWNGRDYWIGDGDEYLRGMPEVFELDPKRIKPKKYKILFEDKYGEADSNIFYYNGKNKVEALKKHFIEFCKEYWEQNNFDENVEPETESEEQEVKKIADCFDSKITFL